MQHDSLTKTSYYAGGPTGPRPGAVEIGGGKPHPATGQKPLQRYPAPSDGRPQQQVQTNSDIARQANNGTRSASAAARPASSSSTRGTGRPKTAAGRSGAAVPNASAAGEAKPAAAAAPKAAAAAAPAQPKTSTGSSAGSAKGNKNTK